MPMPILTLEPQQDSYISGTNRSLNFGSDPFVVHDVVYAGGTKVNWRRAIVNFDVSALGGTIIASAKLVRKIYTITNPGRAAVITRCTRPSQWTEDGVTWNTYDGVNAWTNPGGDTDDVGPPARIDYTEALDVGTHELSGLKPFVDDALANRGGIVALITHLADEAPEVTTQFAWRSKEHGADIWRLVIDFEQPNRGRRGGRRSPLARGAGAAQPARTARPAAPQGGARPARPA